MIGERIVVIGRESHVKRLADDLFDLVIGFKIRGQLSLFQKCQGVRIGRGDVKNFLAGAVIGACKASFVGFLSLTDHTQYILSGREVALGYRKGSQIGVQRGVERDHFLLRQIHER